MKLYEEGNMTVKQICEITSVSRSSLYRKFVYIPVLIERVLF
ncbi:helix-turn-helix domain-containing protein [Bacillus thuringiensis]|nr:helix-turn-helix domain-containing protein [Bacillus thuringiensis]MED3272491.1 helix-turn-helix domain-containing protein [Bacillus thuringiensis]